MIFGGIDPEISAGTTTGKNSDFSKIVDGDMLILKVDGGGDVQTKFEAGDNNIANVVNRIDNAMGPRGSILDSGGELNLASSKILVLHPPKEPWEKEERRLTEAELQKSQVEVSGSSCVLGKLGLTAGIYNAHYVWNGQFFGLSIIGNAVNSVYAKWAIEFPSTSGSVGIVLSGNQISGECRNRDSERKCIDEPEAVAAIVSRSQINMDISGNSCVGVFEGKDYAGIGDDLFRSHNSFHGQDRSGHEFFGDLRFGITVLNDSSVLDSHSYTFHIKTVNIVTFTLPDHHVGKRLLFKNVGLQPTTLKPASGRIDDMSSYTLKQYDFVELEDDGTDYWIIRKMINVYTIVQSAIFIDNILKNFCLEFTLGCNLTIPHMFCQEKFASFQRFIPKEFTIRLFSVSTPPGNKVVFLIFRIWSFSVICTKKQ